MLDVHPGPYMYSLEMDTFSPSSERPKPCTRKRLRIPIGSVARSSEFKNNYVYRCFACMNVGAWCPRRSP
ncbi:hypothetical protein LEMLEM_LOCUS27312, partial [Lemmus lemmus]